MNASGPDDFWWHGHQDGLGIAACFQAEERPPVIKEVELHITAPSPELGLTVSIRPGSEHPPPDDAGIAVQEGFSHIPGEGEVIGEVLAVQPVIEDAAQPTGFVAVFQEEILITPFLEAGIVVRVVSVAGLLKGPVERGRIFEGFRAFREHGRDVATPTEPSL